MKEVTAYSEAKIGNPDKGSNDDYAVDKQFVTPAGLHLQVGIICDGVSSAEWGIRAARLAGDTVLQYMEQSPERSIPDLIIAAIQQANQVVLNTISGNATSTISVIVVHLNDPKETVGRLYIGSVGDSPICLIRGKKITRLNTDHSVLNEALLRGMNPNQAYQLSNPRALTRAIGADSRVEVDLGFYINTENSSLEEIQARGWYGLSLKEGDTIFASSDGLFDMNQADGLPFVHDDEFLKYGRSTDVKSAVIELLSRATQRGPYDNISISMIFLPGKREVVRSEALSRRVIATIGLGAIIAVCMIGGLLFALRQSEEKGSKADSTRLAAQDILTQTFEWGQTQTAIPTSTPTLTLTPSVTPTFTPQPTLRPTLIDDAQVGWVQQVGAAPRQLLVNAAYSASSVGVYLMLDGGSEKKPDGSQIIEPASIFMKPYSQATINDVDVRSLSAELVLHPGSSIFVSAGEFDAGGVNVVLQEDLNIVFTARGIQVGGVGISYVAGDANAILYSCYSQYEESCQYQLEFGQIQSVLPNTTVLLNIKERAVITSQALNSQDTEDTFYHFILALTGASEYPPLLAYVDTDDDTVNDIDDQCHSEPGKPELGGCPDSDNDGLIDSRDHCPASYGPTSNNGCPLPDRDGDGVLDSRDACPSVFGSASNHGCPVGSR